MSLYLFFLRFYPERQKLITSAIQLRHSLLEASRHKTLVHQVQSMRQTVQLCVCVPFFEHLLFLRVGWWEGSLSWRRSSSKRSQRWPCGAVRAHSLTSSALSLSLTSARLEGETAYSIEVHYRADNTSASNCFEVEMSNDQCLTPVNEGNSSLLTASSLTSLVPGVASSHGPSETWVVASSSAQRRGLV